MRTIYKLALAAALLTTTFSCSKSFLEIKPKGRIIATKTSDYDLLFNNLDLININSDAQVLLGDEMAAMDPYFTGLAYREKQLFTWQADVYKASEDSKETLIPLKDIYIYNKIIAEVMSSTGGTDVNKMSLQAEAYGGRAWTYFFLINYFGQPYDSTTADKDAGFPLITVDDINGSNYTRASVKQVYDLIISDLQKAIPNLSNVGVFHPVRMSKAAAEGMLAKVYIYMGRYAEAAPLLDAALSDLAQSTYNVQLQDYNVTYPLSTTVATDLENAYAKNVLNAYTVSGNNLLWLKPETVALYGPTDVRFTKGLSPKTFSSGQTLYRRVSGYGLYIGVRIPELYLLRAEVTARLGNLTDAVTQLVAFRSRRMPAADAAVPASATADKLSLLKFIFDERTREFAGQGYRWFDMRRMSVDPLFAGAISYWHRVYDATGVPSDSFALSVPNRWVLRIPPKILAQNPAMTDNP
jgi:starch-binding outer membrane protein, SusD/RagB family